MSRWAYDAIIHSHSQVFIILRALTVKPSPLLFCLVIPFHPTVYKIRNINQRLQHPANTGKWKQLSQPIIQKHRSDDPGWCWGALPGVASKGLSTGPEMVPFCAHRRSFNFKSCLFNCVFVFFLLTSVFRHPTCIFTMHKYRPMTPKKTKINFLSCQNFCWVPPTV